MHMNRLAVDTALKILDCSGKELPLKNRKWLSARMSETDFSDCGKACRGKNFFIRGKAIARALDSTRQFLGLTHCRSDLSLEF